MFLDILFCLYIYKFIYYLNKSIKNCLSFCFVIYIYIKKEKDLLFRTEVIGQFQVHRGIIVQ